MASTGRESVALDVEKLQREHEAMASTLSEVENHVSPAVMAVLRRHYMECILAGREAAA